MSFANLRTYIYHKCTFKKTVSISCKTTSSTSTHTAKCHFLSQNLRVKKKWITPFKKKLQKLPRGLGSPRCGETSDHGLHIQGTGLAKWHLNLSLQTAGACCCWFWAFFVGFGYTKTIIIHWHNIYLSIYLSIDRSIYLSIHPYIHTYIHTYMWVEQLKIKTYNHIPLCPMQTLRWPQQFFFRDKIS